MDAAFLSAKRRGVIAGLQLAIALPEAEIMDLVHDIEKIEDQERIQEWQEAQTRMSKTQAP